MPFSGLELVLPSTQIGSRPGLKHSFLKMELSFLHIRICKPRGSDLVDKKFNGRWYSRRN